MSLFFEFKRWNKLRSGDRMPVKIRFLSIWLIFNVFLTSCESDSNLPNWVNVNSLSISQYIEKNRTEFSKFHQILTKGKMLNTLYGYNPNGDNYTLFLPTNEAVDRFISQHEEYENFEALLADTIFVKELTRYHTLNSSVHTDQLPEGALNEKNLTGDRLVFGFLSGENNQFVNVNNSASIVKPNLKMTNGYIHVVSGILQKSEVSGYDWLQSQGDYSILAETVRLAGIKNRLWWDKYTIMAEHDSIYHRNGIYRVEDLIDRIATPGLSYSNTSNAFYLYAAYHFLYGEYFLNDFSWGTKKYSTLSGKQLTITVDAEMKINPNIDIYGYTISKAGDTTFINYIRPVWKSCNIMTQTGSFHTISEMMHYQPMPEN